MKITELLKTGDYYPRLIVGTNRWLVWDEDTSEWVVWEKKLGHQASQIIYHGASEDDAVAVLAKDDDA